MKLTQPGQQEGESSVAGDVESLAAAGFDVDFEAVRRGAGAQQRGIGHGERARRLAQQIKDAGVEVWLQDRVYLAKSTGIAVNVWAVYAGRYTDSSSAMQSLQEWPASLKTYKPLPRSLVRLRTEAYPERMPS